MWQSPVKKNTNFTDVQGLYLLIKPSGSKRWYLKYRFAGKENRIALGAYPQVTLGKAREQRDSIKIIIRNGISHSKKREVEKQEAIAETLTFEKVARDWHSSNKQWSIGTRFQTTTKDYCYYALCGTKWLDRSQPCSRSQRCVGDT